MSRPDERLEPALDQLAFGPLAHGLDRVASSMLPAHVSRKWERELLPLVRLLTQAGQEVPDTTLSYFALEGLGVAAVLRFKEGWSGGRNAAHAVVGPAGVLTVRHALAMWSWTPPQTGAGETLDQLTVGDLPAEDPAAARPPAGWLTALVAAHLRRPQGNLTVVGADDDARVPLLRGLVDMLDALWSESDLVRQHTFSTFEKTVDTTVKKAAEIVFLPGFEDNVTHYAGTLVRLDEPRSADDWAADAAASLVDGYLRGGVAEVAAALAGVCDDPASAVRLRRLRAMTTTTAESTVVLPVTRSDPRVPDPPDPVPQVIFGTAAPAATSGNTAPPPKPDPDPDSTAPRLAERLDRLELAHALVAAATPAEAARLVARLRVAGPDESPARRDAIRDVLLASAFTRGPIDQIGYHDRAVYRVVVAQCFGAHMQDLVPDRREVLALLSRVVADNGTSSLLVRALEEESVRAGRVALVLPAIGLRELRHQAVRVDDPVWWDLLCADPAVHRPSASWSPVSPPSPSWRDRLDGVVVLLLTGVLLFLVGLILGVAQGA